MDKDLKKTITIFLLTLSVAATFYWIILPVSQIYEDMQIRNARAECFEKSKYGDEYWEWHDDAFDGCLLKKGYKN